MRHEQHTFFTWFSCKTRDPPSGASATMTVMFAICRLERAGLPPRSEDMREVLAAYHATGAEVVADAGGI